MLGSYGEGIFFGSHGQQYTAQSWERRVQPVHPANLAACAVGPRRRVAVAGSDVDLRRQANFPQVVQTSGPLGQPRATAITAGTQYANQGSQ